MTVALCLEKNYHIWEGLISGLGEGGFYKALMPVSTFFMQLVDMADLQTWFGLKFRRKAFLVSIWTDTCQIPAIRKSRQSVE